MSVSSSVPFSFLGRLHLENRVTKLVCHRIAPEEKPEATIGKWGRLKFPSGGALSSGTVAFSIGRCLLWNDPPLDRPSVGPSLGILIFGAVSRPGQGDTG